MYVPNELDDSLTSVVEVIHRCPTTRLGSSWCLGVDTRGAAQSSVRYCS